jgi:hypothetical protein
MLEGSCPEIRDQPHPIRSLEHRFASAGYCKRMFQIADWRWLNADFGPYPETALRPKIGWAFPSLHVCYYWPVRSEENEHER